MPVLRNFYQNLVSEQGTMDSTCCVYDTPLVFSAATAEGLALIVKSVSLQGGLFPMDVSAQILLGLYSK